jgi:hypothetical protein
MAGKGDRRNPVPVSDLASAVLDPVMRKRAGVSIGLVQSWDEIAGPKLAATTRPEKIVWPRRMSDDDPFEPATLVIACEGFAALRVQHETGEIIGRVNAFLGFNAVGRVRIVQKPVRRVAEKQKPRLRPVSPAEEAKIARTVGGVEDQGLRASLERLGRTIAGSKRRGPPEG